ncbi:MAG: hypothetical protein V8S98_05155 [Lachnospiraceae bacterium]
MAGDERSIKVKIDHVRRVLKARKGGMIALIGIGLDIIGERDYLRGWSFRMR